jgi:Zn-finger nucleic acid-binding protein
METICPSCLAVISNAAKFCHHCGTSIAPEEIAAEATDRGCPGCGPSHKLHSRALGDSGFSALECTRCAGLWVGEAAFEALEGRERETAAPAADARTIRDEIKSRPKVAPKPGPFYRACPVCSTAMTRINFSRISGILIDRCREHGIWFDATELDAALRWIQIGGEKAAQRRETEEAKARTSQERFKIVLPDPNDPRGARVAWSDQNESRGELFPWILGMLFK